ncbi:MAG: hypothetical protein U0271_02690 [Polyangiaceae bacterium]
MKDGDAPAPNWPAIPIPIAAPSGELPVASEPLEALNRSLREVALPPGTSTIQFLRGSVLALTTLSDVIRISPEGKAQRIKGPSCEESFSPGLTIYPDYRAIMIEGGHLALYGRLFRSGRGESHLGYRSVQTRGGWTCEGTHPPIDVSIAPGDVVWSVPTPHYPAELINDSRFVPSANLEGLVTAFYGRTADRAWLAADGLEHLDGMSWSRVNHPFKEIKALTEDPSGTLWVIGEREKQLFAGALPPNGDWIWIAAPPDFDATFVIAASGEDVWFLGDKTFYQYDGRVLRSMPAPLHSPTAWVGAAGEIWVGGADPSGAVVGEDPLQGRDTRVGKLLRIEASVTANSAAVDGRSVQ